MIKWTQSEMCVRARVFRGQNLTYFFGILGRLSGMSGGMGHSHHSVALPTQGEANEPKSRSGKFVSLNRAFAA